MQIDSPIISSTCLVPDDNSYSRWSLSVLLWMRVFSKCLKCKCNVSDGFVVLCRWKPVLIPPSKHRADRPQQHPHPPTVVFTAMWVNQLNFYICIVLPTSCSCSVSAGGQIAVSAKPNIHGLYPGCELM